jgi:hypothetical protein
MVYRLTVENYSPRRDRIGLRRHWIAVLADEAMSAELISYVRPDGRVHQNFPWWAVRQITGVELKYLPNRSDAVYSGRMAR